MISGGSQGLPDEPEVSVVVPCRDHARELARCLPSLMAQKIGAAFEVIVVDAAADPEVAAVAHAHPGVRLARSSRNLLPGEARNLGAETARGRYLAFIDADCVADSAWLASALKSLGPDTAVVGGAVLQGAPLHPVAVIDNLMQFSEVPPGRPAGAATLMPSCNMAVARWRFQALGGFPLPQGNNSAGEDVLFCMRAGERWPGGLRFDPDMRVRHFGRRGFGEMCRHQWRFGWARGFEGLALRPAHQRLGRLAVLMPAVAGRRLAHFLRCALAWRRSALVPMAVFMPVLACGLAAWAHGFSRGCRARASAVAARGTSNLQILE